MREIIAFNMQSGANGTPEVPFYSEKLIDELQSALATLANIEAQFEIARDSMEEWSGPEEERQRCCTDLNQAYRRAREPYLQWLTCLEEQVKMLHRVRTRCEARAA